jgi:AcrR family transcriptional regulator
MRLTVLTRPALKSARKAKGDGWLRRAEILAAAERIFVRDGYEGATIRKIADEVGVSSTALYVHFRDKSEMLFEICECAFARMEAANVAVSADTTDPLERVRRMLDAYLDFALANPNAYWLVFNGGPGSAMDEHKKEAANHLGKQCYARFEAAFIDLAGAERLRAAPEVACQAMWASVHGLASLLISKSEFPWADKAVLRRALVDGMFDGLVRS